MTLQEVKVSACYESETNPRGKDFGGKAFDELVASIKEQGILTPVLVRPSPKPNPHPGTQFEIVAGNRRFRAAQQLKLETIPAQIQEMTDSEAREAQIVENLQRQDVHPLEEGEAYRALIEESGLTVADIGIKVGKSETYVRNRLFLTNLAEPAAKAYRKGEIPDTFAVVIARLSPSAQGETIKYVKNDYRDVDLNDLKTFIQNKFSNPLSFQPWMKDEAIAKVVGACKECPPNRTDLFGALKEGQCTDLKCWRIKMAAFVAFKKENDPELALVSTEYGKAETPWAISKSEYRLLETKKDLCDFAQRGLVVEGDEMGKIVNICASMECNDHHAQRTDYAQSPKEKENRKKEQEKDEAKRKAFDLAITTALEKVTFPLSKEHLDALLDIVLQSTGQSYLMPICKRHGLKGEKMKDGRRDYRTPLQTFAHNQGHDGNLRMIFELHLPTYYSGNDDKAMKARIAKL